MAAGLCLAVWWLWGAAHMRGGERSGRVTAERSPLGSPDASPLRRRRRRRVRCGCVRVRETEKKLVRTHTHLCVSKRSDSADPAASARLPFPPPHTPLPPLLRSPALYGRAHRSPSQLLNLILSWREPGKKGREDWQKSERWNFPSF